MEVSTLHYDPIGRGVFSFFMGGLIYLIYRSIIRYKYFVGITRFLMLCTPCLWLATIADVKLGFIRQYFFPIIFGSDASAVYPVYVSYFSTGLLFPLTILTLASIETLIGRFGSRFALIGDISDSTYLIHFPLQFIFVIGTSIFEVPRTFFYSSFSLILFFSALIPISFLSYRYLERSAQYHLRTILLKPRVQSI